MTATRWAVDREVEALIDGTLVGPLLAGLLVAGIVVGVVVMRTSGPRPDAPMKGADEGDRRAAQDGSQWTADRLGGPGQEAEHPARATRRPGTRGDDQPGRDD